MLCRLMTQHGGQAPLGANGRTSALSSIDGIDVAAGLSVRSKTRPWSSRSAELAARMLLVILVVLLAPARAHAAPFDVNDSTWEGCSELFEIARTELGAARVRAVGVLNWEEVTPDDGVLVLHPLQPMDPDETAAFMKAGGRLAIVDDYGVGDETLRRFHIERTAIPSRPVIALRNRPQFAIAEPVVDPAVATVAGPHPVVARVQQVVTNHATGLRHPNLSPVLRIRGIGEPDVIIAVAGQVGKGRLFAMSDPSALMNLMLRYPGNRAMVAGLARYLVDEDNAAARKGRLFIVANRFAEEGAFGGPTTLRKDLDSQLRAIANALADARRDGLPGWAHVLLAALAMLAVGGWVAQASSRPYKSPLPRYARPTPLVAQGGVAGRFALLAAPSSPRSLVLLELKSALFDALCLKLDLPRELSVSALVTAVTQSGSVDERLESSLKEVLATMQRAETAIVAGKPIQLPVAVVEHAANVVQEVLAACKADFRDHPPARNHGEQPPPAPPAGESTA
jgi:hypothetical protein